MITITKARGANWVGQTLKSGCQKTENSQQKIHKIAYGKLLQEIHVLLRSDNYFRCEAMI